MGRRRKQNTLRTVVYLEIHKRWCYDESDGRQHIEERHCTSWVAEKVTQNIHKFAKGINGLIKMLASEISSSGRQKTSPVDTTRVIPSGPTTKPDKLTDYAGQRDVTR